MQLSFAQLEMNTRIKRQSKLNKADAVIEWEALRPLLQGLYKREATHGGGQEPIDPLIMFKAILLGQWHSLSDPKLEEALYVRIDFMQFCGLSMLDRVPDETTLCRFRNRLVRGNKLKPLFDAVNAQLQKNGLMVEHAQGAVLDATFITSAARPKRQITIEEIASDDSEAANSATNNAPSDAANGTANTSAGSSAEGNNATSNTTSNKYTVEAKLSADPDATWTKKGKQYSFGHRGTVVVDAVDGYVVGVHTTPANVSEFKSFAPALATVTSIKPRRLYADKGYASAANRAHLQGQEIKSAIMHKANRNKPLSKRQKNANKCISRTRYIVEQCFGTLKRIFKMGRASYMGTVKVNSQLLMKAICLNLLKAANKIHLTPPKVGEVRLEGA